MNWLHRLGYVLFCGSPPSCSYPQPEPDRSGYTVVNHSPSYLKQERVSVEAVNMAISSVMADCEQAWFKHGDQWTHDDEKRQSWTTIAEPYSAGYNAGVCRLIELIEFHSRPAQDEEAPAAS